VLKGRARRELMQSKPVQSSFRAGPKTAESLALTHTYGAAVRVVNHPCFRVFSAQR